VQNCKYCGQEALYQLKNGAWCCKSSSKLCPEIIRKSSESRKGAKRTSEMKERISLAHIGQRSSKRGKNYTQFYGNERAQIIKEKMRKRKLLALDNIKEKHPFFCKVEDLKEVDGSIYVRCTLSSCRKWFKPTYTQFYERIRQLEKEYGNGGCYFYCSLECKQKCSLYKLNPTIKDKEFIPDTNYQVWRDEVFKRQEAELGFNQCEICGNTNKKELSIHHEKPVKLYPHLAYDPDNGIVLCGARSSNKCHYKYGHKDECSTGKLQRKIPRKNNKVLTLGGKL